jgi:hypothetical protein
MRRAAHNSRPGAARARPARSRTARHQPCSGSRSPSQTCAPDSRPRTGSSRSTRPTRLSAYGSSTKRTTASEDAHVNAAPTTTARPAASRSLTTGTARRAVAPHRRIPKDGRLEVALTGAAGVSHCGRRHPRNEDASGWVVVEDVTIVVVCDGVSSSSHPHVASRAGRRGRRSDLRRHRRPGRECSAVAAAQGAVERLPTGRFPRAAPPPLRRALRTGRGSTCPAAR